MRATSTTTLDARIDRAGQRWAKLRAQQLLVELRGRAKAQAEQRRHEQHRRLQLGDVVLSVDSEWDTAELLGALLDAQERLARSPTQRLAARKRGEQFLHGSAEDSAPHTEEQQPSGVPVIDEKEAERQLLAALNA